MTVVYAADHNLYPVLPTVINSLLLNNPDTKVYIFAEDDEIYNISHPNITVINYKIFQKYMLPTSPQAKEYYIPYPTFIRLWIADVLQEDKVLYLDVDTIVDGNLAELWHIDITNFTIAGAKDISWNKYLQYTNTYINAGVILFNLKKWRELNLSKQATDLLNTKKFRYGDQDIINLLCDKNKLIINNRYNHGRYTAYWESQYPILIHHWPGKPKVWEKTADDGSKKLWAKYYTPFLKK